jgi:uncharacterized Tic20 family protein
MSVPPDPNNPPIIEPKPGGGPDDKEARQMAMLAHLLGALIGFLGPLIIWIIKKDTSSFVDDQGKEALNFQLTMLIGYVVSGFLMLACIGYFTAIAIWLMSLIFGIIGGMKASEGQYYRYPITIRMIQ